MSFFPEQPFDEREERYMLAEILKDSPIPPATLLRVIQGEGVRPRWTEIALPHGRSVSACQKAFNNLCSRVFQLPVQPVGQPPQISPSATPRKRPAGTGDISMGLNRELQPRTPGFVTVNEPVEPTAYPPALADSVDQRKKKRGRPSKAEVEVKAAEYAARGEPYPPPRKSKNPKQSAEATNPIGPSITFTPVTMGPSGTEAGSLGKKRAPKPKTQKDDIAPSYGPTPSPFQPIHGESGDPARFHGPLLPGSRTESSEPSLKGLGPAVQAQTTEGQSHPEPYKHESEQARPQSSPNREEASTEQQYEAGREVPQASNTVPQQTTAENGSPAVAHSPKQV
ncbi:MAG: hypothetical protein Q9219_001718 [cf. Caloplaca sp. 3 TL-2023]